MRYIHRFVFYTHSYQLIVMQILEYYHAISVKYYHYSIKLHDIQNLQLLAADQLNMFDILNSEKIVATRSAIARIHEVYGGDAKLATEIVTVEDAE